jgi:hypothetical protein
MIGPLASITSSSFIMEAFCEERSCRSETSGHLIYEHELGRCTSTQKQSRFGGAVVATWNEPVRISMPSILALFRIDGAYHPLTRYPELENGNPNMEFGVAEQKGRILKVHFVTLVFVINLEVFQVHCFISFSCCC